MHVSKYNLLFDVGEDEKVIFNPLSGAIDILYKEETSSLEKVRLGGKIGEGLLNQFLSRGYVFEKKEDEDKELRRIYQRFEDAMKDRGERFILIQTYDCNLRCEYCYQDESMRDPSVMKESVLSKFFETVEILKNENTIPCISLFGGEPLMRKNKDAVKDVTRHCKERNWEMLASTNGVDLDSYFDVLDPDVFKQIQVTVDGTKEYHDKRRIFLDGSGSFDKIVKGIDKALEKIPIVLRVNIDRENVENLPKFADFIIEKGWTDKNLHAYISPVKSVFGMKYSFCLPDYKILENVFEYLDQYPQMEDVFSLEGWQGADSISRLLKKGELFPPQFKNCEANIDMLAFDLYGDAYTCLELVGRKEFSIGKYYPEMNFNKNLKKWRNRSIFTIPECKECNVNILCGGGCAALALDKKGSLYSNHCKPVKKALELSISHYFPKLKALGEKNEIP